MFGQIVAAAIVVSEDFRNFSIDEIHSYLKLRLAVYKLPKILRVVKSIPKNHLGKVYDSLSIFSFTSWLQVNKKTLWRDLRLDE